MSISPITPTASPGRVARALASLSVFRDPNYRWYWACSFAYYVGFHMEMTARAQLAYDLTGQAFMLGLAALSQGLPSSLMSIMGGALADRFPKRTMLLFAQSVLALSGILMFVLLATDMIEFWHVLAIGAIRGLNQGFSMPARLSMVSEVVEEEHFLKAYGFYYIALNTMRIGGPAIAGTLIGLTGGSTLAFLIIGIAHIVGFFALLPVFSRKKAGPKEGRGTSILQDVGGMFSFAWHTPTIMVLLGAEMGITFFAMAATPLLPVFADRVFKAPHGVGLAMLQGAQGVGGLIGSMTITAFSGIKRKPLMLLCVGVCQGLSLILFSNMPVFSLAVATIGFVGFSQACYTTLNSTLFQVNAPPGMRGRAMSLYLLGNSAQPLGALPIGYFGDIIGVQAIVTITASLLIGYMVGVAFLFPAFRKQKV